MFGIFGRRKSRQNVKERLKLVLSYDRAKLTPGKMEELKTELLGVIGKYFPSEDQQYDVRFEQHGDRMVLLANLPVTADPGTDAPVAETSSASAGEDRSAERPAGKSSGTGSSGTGGGSGKKRSRKRKSGRRR
ncbi:MAG TPA: cell division topological specificity factor MinE [Deinococcales bacterium]|nr:cell division topological specificity factor MinE [Deinococcales bacterium]